MQKLDFVKNLETITELLQSSQITEKFKKGFSLPSNYPYSDIKPSMFISKSNYDKLKEDSRYSEILNSLNGEEIYSGLNLSHLTSVLQHNNASAIIGNNNAVDFFNFHNTLLSTLNLSKNILLNDTLERSSEINLDEGVIIFQIVIDGEGLESETYIKIFTALQELIETINKIELEDEKTEIILLDSGSDTNIGIKTGIETAKSLFLIFKEIWDYITNYRLYNNAQKNKALLESLSIRSEIQKKVDEKILTEEEGKEYLHLIKTRTDDLIGLKVMPKQIVIETNQIENKKLLSGLEGTKLLTSGE